MVVVGDKEAAEGAVSPRLRTGEEIAMMPLDEFARRLEEEASPRLP
jgi:threonyl-tRNA synthetase